MLGIVITQNLIEQIEDMGIELSNDNEVYFLHEIREALDIIFGMEAADIVMGPIRNILDDAQKSTHATDFAVYENCKYCKTGLRRNGKCNNSECESHQAVKRAEDKIMKSSTKFR
jgi:hypothetical protein